MVFMRHGLNVALFVTFCVLAMATLARVRRPLFTLPANLFTAYLSVILLACKSVGAIIYALFFLPIALLASPRNQVRVAALIAALVFSYPVIRAVDLVPTEAITGFIERNVSERRAGSLSYRFDNEALIMDKARERLLFGWGDYSRFWRYDPLTGDPTTIVDGLWAITIGSRGLVGHISVFGLLLFPIFTAWRKLKFIRASRDRSLIAGLSLIAAVFACDFVPNSSVDAAITFCVGGLAGVVPGILREQRLSRRRSGERSRRAPEDRIGAPE